MDHGLSRLAGGELPMDTGLVVVARGDPGIDPLFQRFDIRRALVQALARKGGELDLGHVEPTAMLGRVMELQFLEDCMGFFRREGLVQRARLVGIEIPTTAGDLNRFIDGWIKPDVPVPRHLFSIIATHSSADSEKVDLGVQQRSVAPILEVAESISKFDRYLGVMAFLRNADRYFSQRTGHYADFPL